MTISPIVIFVICFALFTLAVLAVICAVERRRV